MNHETNNEMNWQIMHLAQPVLYVGVCLQSISTKGNLHPLPTLQNNEPVPQGIEKGSQPVLLQMNLVIKQ